MDLQLTPVRQHVARYPIADIAEEVRQGLQALPLDAHIKPDMRIALAVGSRGISCLQPVVQTVITELRALGAQPFLIPAMGSHGSSTAEGQQAVLEGYGLAESGVPILSNMEATQIGTTEAGMPVYFDINAQQADGIIAINRIKEHTAFKGRWESGLCKILSVGLGKRDGAAVMHQWGIRDAIPSAAQVIFAKMPIIAGIGIVEDGYHMPAKIAVLPADCIMDEEPHLLDMARKMLPRIPIEPLDLLLIQEMGKNISGTGMDLNVIGMWRRNGGPIEPQIAVIGVLDITADSHGNAIGVGHAELITQRLHDKIDLNATYTNCLTSRNFGGGKIPITLPTDRALIEMSLAGIPADRARVIVIRNTLELDKLWVSEALLPEVAQMDNLEPFGAAQSLKFDGDDCLILPVL